jgi:16S rRNA (guanine527-N7)-methyltransferase
MSDSVIRAGAGSAGASADAAAVAGTSVAAGAAGASAADGTAPPAAGVSSAAVPDAGLAAAAAEMFGASLPVAQRYAELLTGDGVERGVVGPAEADRIWDRHLLNCGAIARLIPAKCTLVDLGSGAGLPGIVLAMLLPGARVTLLEPLARRAEFLRECVAELGLANTQVLRGRAEDLAGQVLADVVTARAVAPLDKLAGLCLGLARPGGRVLAIKGASADAELVKARPVLARLGVTDARVVQAGSAGVGTTATVVTFTAPEHRASGASGAGRVAARADGRPAGRPGGRASAFPGGAAGGRKTRPNSRRAGG